MNRIPVKEIHDLHEVGYKTVTESAKLDEVVRTFADGITTQIVFVVDEDEHYRGALTRKDLLSLIAVKMVGGETSRAMTIGNMRQILFASNAGDLMRGGARVPVVSESLNIAEALRLMMASGEPVLPVVDDDGKLVGDLRVSEILSAVLNFDEASQQVVQAGRGAR